MARFPVRPIHQLQRGPLRLPTQRNLGINGKLSRQNVFLRDTLAASSVVVGMYKYSATAWLVPLLRSLTAPSMSYVVTGLPRVSL